MPGVTPYTDAPALKTLVWGLSYHQLRIYSVSLQEGYQRPMDLGSQESRRSWSCHTPFSIGGWEVGDKIGLQIEQKEAGAVE